MSERIPAWVQLKDREEIESLGSVENVAVALSKLIHQPPRGSAFRRHQEMTRLTKKLLDHYVEISDVNKRLIRMNEVLSGATGARERKRWEDREDELLVDQAVLPENNIVKLAVMFERSPGAITSRLSYLVGIRKMSVEVAGRLTGFIDGIPVDGVVQGTVTKST